LLCIELLLIQYREYIGFALSTHDKPCSESGLLNIPNPPYFGTDKSIERLGD